MIALETLEPSSRAWRRWTPIWSAEPRASGLSNCNITGGAFSRGALLARPPRSDLEIGLAHGALSGPLASRSASAEGTRQSRRSQFRARHHGSGKPEPCAAGGAYRPLIGLSALSSGTIDLLPTTSVTLLSTAPPSTRRGSSRWDRAPI